MQLQTICILKFFRGGAYQKLRMGHFFKKCFKLCFDFSNRERQRPEYFIYQNSSFPSLLLPKTDVGLK